MSQVLKIAFDTARALAHMHSQNPPVAHRDIKVGRNEGSHVLSLLRVLKTSSPLSFI
jgi:serine/threonine protein kinase